MGHLVFLETLPNHSKEQVEKCEKIIQKKVTLMNNIVIAQQYYI